MKRYSFNRHPIPWIAGILTIAIVLILGCNSTQAIPATQIVEVTRVVPVTQLVQSQKYVPVTRIVRVTRVVEVPRAIPLPTQAPILEEVPAPTEAPTALEAPLVTEAPAISIVHSPTPIKIKNSNDLLVWYDFEDDFQNTGIIVDRSNHGHEARISGSVDVSDGVFGGRSIFFYGDGFIYAQDNPAAGRNIVSFSLWFRTDHPEENYKLASAAWWNGGPGSGWIIGTHYPEFWSDDTKSIFLDGRGNEENGFMADGWNQEVVTYDGQRIREYTNGQLINDWPITGATIGKGQAMAVGAWPGFGFNFRGSIDEFKIFAKCLTQKEVQTFYSQGK